MNDHSNNEGPFKGNSGNPNSHGQANSTSEQQMHTQNNFDQGQYNQAPYNQAQFNQGQYNQAQYNQAQYSQGPYGQYPPPPVGGYPYPPMYTPKKTNTKSIVGLILGIASIVLPYIGFFIGIAGIIVNAISLKEIKNTHEEGKGLAIGGLVTSILGTVLYLVVILFVIFVFAIVAETNNYYY